jgi:ABC-type amino acid transport system permease subunit
MWDVLITYHRGFLHGLLVTIKLAGVIWAVGLTVGSLCGWSAHKYPRVIGKPLSLLAFIASGIPVLVFLFWAHYPLQTMLQVVIDPFITAAWVLSVVNMFAVADIVRSGLARFPVEFLSASKVCGLPRRTTLVRIALPLVLRDIGPTLLTSQVVMLQMTLFASVISVEEVLRVAQRINATAYKPVEIYSALALLFLVICLPLNGIAIYLRRRFGRSLSER